MDFFHIFFLENFYSLSVISVVHTEHFIVTTDHSLFLSYSIKLSHSFKNSNSRDILNFCQQKVI